MNGIEQYIDAIIEDIETTITNSKRFGLNEEAIPKWEGFLRVLRERNVDDIVSLINENMGFFYTTPVGELLFRNEIEREYVYKALTNGRYGYGAFGTIKLEEIFSDEKAKALLDGLSQGEYNKFIRARLPYLEKDSPEYIKVLLDRFTDRAHLFTVLHKPLVKDYVVSTPELAGQLIENMNTMYLEGPDYRVLWDNNRDTIANLSHNQKMQFIQKVKEIDISLATEMFSSLGLLDNMALVDLDVKEVLPLCTEEVKKDLLYRFIEEDKEAGYIMAQLSLESQLEVIASPRFLNTPMKTRRLDSILDELHPDIFRTKVNQDVVETPERLLKFYDKTKDVTFLEKAKNKLLQAESAQVLDNWIRHPEFCNYLSESEREQLSRLITFPSNVDELKTFFSSTTLFEDRNYFIDIMCVNAMNFVRENKDLNIPLYHGLEKIYGEEDLRTIFFSLSKTKQLEQMDSFKLIPKFMYEALKQNPKFYEGVDFKTQSVKFFFTEPEANKEYIEYIFSCLDENQRKVFFHNKILSVVTSLKDEYRAYVFSNPSDLTRICEEFFTEEELKEIYTTCSIKVYSLPTHISLIDKDHSYYNNRIAELITAVNQDVIGLNSWIKYLSPENMDLFMNSLKSSKIIDLLNSTKDKNMRRTILDLIIKNSTTSDMLELYDSKFTVLFTRLSQEEMSYLITNLDNFGLIVFLNKIKLDALETEFMARLKNNTLNLGEPSTISLFQKVFLRLNDENKTYITDLIESQFEVIDKFPELKNKVATMELVAKASFIYAVNNGLINDNNIDFVMEMLQKDPFLLNSLDTRLLREDVMAMGEHFTRKTSRYPLVAHKLMEVFDRDPELAEFLVAASKHLMATEASYDSYDSKMEIILNFLAHTQLTLDIKDFDDNFLENFEDYIIQQYRIIQQQSSYDPIKYEILDSKFNGNIGNYHNERRTYLDNMLTEVKNINELRNLFYNRYFWLDYGAVQNFMYSYAENYGDVCEYAKSDLPLKYIELIRKIEAIEDFATLAELYKNMTEEYSISDYMTIQGIMKNAYNKANAEVVNRRLMGEVVTKEIMVDGQVVRQKMMELSPPYGLFVHSTDAYGAMEMINDNYFDSWNYNSNTENHGICTCYITNTSYGTANVKGKGVMFGFNQINEHSIATMGPYDLVTRNAGYTITSHRPPLYMRMDKVSSYTRHTHNEFDLERRNDTLEQRYPCIQPDCVVIFEDMPEEIKANALKAVSDFKERGVELQVVYIDRVKNLRQEGELISKGLEEYSTTHNLSLLSHIIDRYESNLCGCDFFSDIDIKDILSTTKLESALEETVQYLRSIPDISVRSTEIKEFINILNNEQRKFDLIKETVGNRAHKFDLYSDALKEQVSELLSLTQAPLEYEGQKLAS